MQVRSLLSYKLPLFTAASEIQPHKHMGKGWVKALGTKIYNSLARMILSKLDGKLIHCSKITNRNAQIFNDHRH